MIRSVSLISAAFCLLAACGDAARPGADPLDVPMDGTVSRTEDPVVARVEGTEIYHSDVERAAAGQGLIGAEAALDRSDPVFRTVVEELIDQRLLALDAARDGVAQTEEARRRLSAARERILGNLRVEALLAEEVTEEAIRDLYERQRALGNRGEERRARQIVVADADLATDVMARLEDEEDFETLVAELSTDAATLDRGGDLGWSSRDMLAAPIRAAVFQTPVGGRIGPIQTPEGWAVIEVTDQRTPGERSFEEVRDEIERFMTFEAVNALMTDLRGSAEIDRPYREPAPESGPGGQNTPR